MKDRSDSKPHLNSLLWPILVLILLVLQITFPYRGWLALLLGIGITWLVGYLFAWSLLKNVKIIREMRFNWAKVGDTLEERFQLTNSGWIPALWAELNDQSNLPGHQANIVTGISINSSTSWVYHLTCSRRGLFTIGPTSLLTGDPFGIYRVCIYNPAFVNILVTPPILPLPAIQIAGGGHVGEGRPARQALEQSVSVNGVRDFNAGESLRWIHWPTSARRNQLFVKTFENTPISNWWIVLDLEKQLQIGKDQESTEETSVTLAASLADRGINSNLAVGLIINGQEPVWLPPQPGPLQNLKILQALAIVSPGSQPISDLLNNALSSLHYQASLVLITPAISGEWLQAILLLMQRGVVPTVLLLDPLSFGGVGSANNCASLLTNLGIHCYIVTPEILDTSILFKKQSNAWQWRTLATGRALPVHQPDDLTWKVLS